MRRFFYLTLGLLSLALGAIGAVLPLLPTVPFMLLAAFCFARSSPSLEAWLTGHRHFGPHILAWRRDRAVSASGKRAAFLAFGVSAIVGLLVLPIPWSLVPLAAAVIGALWIAHLPTARDD
ncbi:YbaN family protein [Allosphingosinicella sp.]|uniref:YbaN family protein n=1 Tax=Allosphingosinicella sp. TaxID=2823234 RepID=UPI002EE2E002